MAQQDKKKLTYLEVWGMQRESGMWYHVLVIGFRAFILGLFIQLCYQFAIRSFANFSVHPVVVVAAVAIGFLYWFINEWLWKAKQKKQGSAK